MPLNIDFGDGVREVNLPKGNEHIEEKAPIDGSQGEQKPVEGEQKPNEVNNQPPVEETKHAEGEQSTTLEVGTELEFDGQHYKVAENGDIVDDKGTVFKVAAQVEEWLKTVQTEEEKNENENDNVFDVKKLQDAIGVEVTDDKGNAVEFENSVDGIKSYVDSVMDIKSKEIAQSAMNRFMEDNPMVQQFLDYVQINGSPVGFGQIPDRSGIELNKDNEAQLEAVIRMAASEFGNVSLNDNYIKYLKDSGGLFDEAQTQLKNLIAKDKQYIADMQANAAKQREDEAKATEEFWNKVNGIIDSRTIAGFKIPESFTKEQNGKKLIYTPNDFFDYLTRKNVDAENGDKITAYDRDLANMSDDELMQRDLLAAWLMFTGGTYKDLANMQVNENKVKELRLKSKEQRATKPLKFVSKKPQKVNASDLLLS